MFLLLGHQCSFGNRVDASTETGRGNNVSSELGYQRFIYAYKVIQREVTHILFLCYPPCTIAQREDKHFRHIQGNSLNIFFFATAKQR